MMFPASSGFTDLSSLEVKGVNPSQCPGKFQEIRPYFKESGLLIIPEQGPLWGSRNETIVKYQVYIMGI